MNHYEEKTYNKIFQKILINLRIMKLVNYCRNKGKPDVCFIWIPKTAGTSVHTWLNEELGMQKLLTKEYIRRAFAGKGPITFGHIKYLDLVKNGFVSTDYDNTSFKFAFVRNPYDRAVSLYYYTKRMGTIGSNETFRSFLTHIDQGIESIGLYNVCGMSQCNPQMHWISGNNGNYFIDYIAYVEDFKNEILLLSKKLNVKSSIHHKNSTPRDQTIYQLYKDSACFDLVTKIYAIDFLELGYDFDLTNLRPNKNNS